MNEKILLISACFAGLNLSASFKEDALEAMKDSRLDEALQLIQKAEEDRYEVLLNDDRDYVPDSVLKADKEFKELKDIEYKIDERIFRANQLFPHESNNNSTTSPELKNNSTISPKSEKS